MKAGQRNRKVEIQAKTTTQHATFGTPVIGEWETVATVFAELQDMLPSRGERIADGISVARRPCRVRMLYRGVDSTMRLKIGSRYLRIVSMPAELGFQEGIELMCEELTTEGQEP